MRIYGEWKTEVSFLGISCDFIFIPPPHVKKGLTTETELFLPSIPTRFAMDAPQSEGIVKTLSDAVYSESNLIYKLVIND